MTEEEYLSSKGYGRSGFGDVALAKGIIVIVPVRLFFKGKTQKMSNMLINGHLYVLNITGSYLLEKSGNQVELSNSLKRQEGTLIMKR